MKCQQIWFSWSKWSCWKMTEKAVQPNYFLTQTNWDWIRDPDIAWCHKHLFVVGYYIFWGEVSLCTHWVLMQEATYSMLLSLKGSVCILSTRYPPASQHIWSSDNSVSACKSQNWKFLGFPSRVRTQDHQHSKLGSNH